MVQTVLQPVTIDAAGNIALHGRAGVRIPLTFKSVGGELEDVSDSDVFFEVKDTFRVRLEDSVEPGIKYLVLDREDHVAKLSVFDGKIDTTKKLFVLIDETDPDVPQPLWEGKIWIRGFKGAPQSV